MLDPLAGSDTTGAVAVGNGRSDILCELDPEYVHLVRDRIGPMVEAGAAHDEGRSVVDAI